MKASSSSWQRPEKFTIDAARSILLVPCEDETDIHQPGIHEGQKTGGAAGKVVSSSEDHGLPPGLKQVVVSE